MKWKAFMLQKIFISNKSCSFELIINQCILKNKMPNMNQHSCKRDTVFNMIIRNVVMRITGIIHILQSTDTAT